MKQTLDKIVNHFTENMGRYSVAYKWLVLLLSIFIIYYILIIMVLPVVNYRYIIPEEKPGRSKIYKHDFASYYSVDDSLLTESLVLANKEAFLLAGLEMAKDETIGLAIDLSDSTVSLMIQGISIHTSRITGYKCSRILLKSDPFLTTEYFSWPFVVKDYLSSVPKVPVIVKKAPKDSIEAASLPDPGQLEESQLYVSFQFKLDRKLNLKFEQDSISDQIKRKSIRKYRHQKKKEKKKLIRNAFIRAGEYEYTPEIRIKLNRDDALILFRAIPENAKVTVRLNPEY